MAEAADHTSFNETAIETARTLSELRRRGRSKAAAPAERFPPFNRAGLGAALEYARMGNRPVSTELEGWASELGVHLEHLGLTIGTVIHGLDLRNVEEAAVGFIRKALLERKVVFFRDQHLSEDEQVAFGRRFGDLDAFPFGPPGANPYTLEITHGPESPGTENLWHTDVTWMQAPSLGSIAQCTEVPPAGGDTLFSDSHAACLGMPAGLRERIEHLHGIHDYRVFLEGRGGRALPAEVVERIKSSIPFGVSHPLLRTHPETGKTALYIHGGFLRHDSLYDVRNGETLPEDASREIVRALLAQHGRPEYICRFHWEPGSIAFWDNRAAQHYAASDYFPHRRVLRRVTVSGDRPFYDPTREPPAVL